MIGTLGWVLVSILLVALVFIALADATRGTPVERVTARRDRQTPAAGEVAFRHAIEIYTTTPLHPGHRVELLNSGNETYPRLWADLRGAKTLIAIQMYYASMGSVAEELREILVERSRAGVEVLFLYDAFGTSLKKDYLRALRDGGVEVAKFRPLFPHTIHTAHHRAHVRAIVIDAAVGYTGGFGIDDKWLGDGRHEGQWRDTNVRFTGPSVAQLMATFAACWAEATGELIAGRSYFRAGEEQQQVGGAAKETGGIVAGILHAAPTVGSTDGERFFALSIAASRKRLYITNSYFVPDDDFRRLLREAAARGVDVRVLTAGRKSDIRTTYLAGRARYEELLEGGIRIFEYTPSMNHSKSLVVDGIWAAVGTMNADNRSMAFNNEVNLMVHDEGFASAVEKMFIEDLEYATEIDLEEFRRRPYYVRPLELAAHGLSRIL